MDACIDMGVAWLAVRLILISPDFWASANLPNATSWPGQDKFLDSSFFSSEPRFLFAFWFLHWKGANSLWLLSYPVKYMSWIYKSRARKGIKSFFHELRKEWNEISLRYLEECDWTERGICVGRLLQTIEKQFLGNPSVSPHPWTLHTDTKPKSTTFVTSGYFCFKRLGNKYLGYHLVAPYPHLVYRRRGTKTHLSSRESKQRQTKCGCFRNLYPSVRDVSNTSDHLNFLFR